MKSRRHFMLLIIHQWVAVTGSATFYTYMYSWLLPLELFSTLLQLCNLKIRPCIWIICHKPQAEHCIETNVMDSCSPLPHVWLVEVHNLNQCNCICNQTQKCRNQNPCQNLDINLPKLNICLHLKRVNANKNNYFRPSSLAVQCQMIIQQ